MQETKNKKQVQPLRHRIRSPSRLEGSKDRKLRGAHQQLLGGARELQQLIQLVAAEPHAVLIEVLPTAEAQGGPSLHAGGRGGRWAACISSRRQSKTHCSFWKGMPLFGCFSERETKARSRSPFCRIQNLRHTGRGWKFQAGVRFFRLRRLWHQHVDMGQNPVPPVNIPIQPLKWTKMGGAPTPKCDPKTILTHSHVSTWEYLEVGRCFICLDCPLCYQWTRFGCVFFGKPPFAVFRGQPKGKPSVWGSLI